jgi:hypothetical protein
VDSDVEDVTDDIDEEDVDFDPEGDLIIED